MTHPAPPTNEWICQQAQRFGIEITPGRSMPLTDTTNYMAIERDHVIDLEGNLFLVRCDEHEGRFGLGDQPKFWVKRALNLATGTMHILKLVFQEAFKVQVGPLEIRCVRDPEKEGRVLELVRGDHRFMQGRTAHDAHGNLVRVIDFIRGVDLLSYLDSIPGRHEEYCQTVLPGILTVVAGNIAGIQRLHDAGLCHGDIRNDHLLIERETGYYKWIDFDLTQDFSDFDIWSVGNVLHCIAAKRFMTFRDALRMRPGLSAALGEQDASVFFPHRVMNLRKVYPYLPAKLNEVLCRFSFGAHSRYDKISQVTDDLADCAISMTP